MQRAGLYIHIPFCIQKCLYCDFLSYSNRFGQISAYVNALCVELQRRSLSCKKLTFDSIFFGGGTPSCIPEEYIAKILSCIQNNYNLDRNLEISLEMNPGTITPNKIESYKKCGINRISIGIQSTQNRLLKSIGRIHNIEDAHTTIQTLQNNLFTNMNLDFISGIPGICGTEPETLEETLQNIDFAFGHHATHISVYSMITEPETPLYHFTEEGNVQAIDEETERKMYHAIRNKLTQAGFVHYEISNYALPGYQCKHNLKYWQGAPYLGVGLGSASYLPHSENGEYMRSTNTRDFASYITNPFAEGEQEIISLEERRKEYMMLGFRLIAGPDEQLYCTLFQRDLRQDFSKEIHRLTEGKLINNNLSLTHLGLDFQNKISIEFI